MRHARYLNTRTSGLVGTVLDLPHPMWPVTFSRPNQRSLEVADHWTSGTGWSWSGLYLKLWEIYGLTFTNPQ